MKRPFRFSYGESVKIDHNAPTILGPGKIVDVVGMIEIKQDIEASAFGLPIGTHVYTVEYEDGSSVQIPDKHLSPIV